VLDVETGESLKSRDVFISGEKIEMIARTGDLPATPDTMVIRGVGATLLPGLIDLHAHTSLSAAPENLASRPDPKANLAAYLYCGVTTVADLGGVADTVLLRRDRIAAGTLLGPTLYVAGPVFTAVGGHPVPILRMLLPGWLGWYAIPRYAVEVNGPEDAAAAAERIATMGVDFLKVIVDRIPPPAPKLDARELAAIVEVARRRRLRVVAHIGTTEDAMEAAEAGVAAWAHVVYRERIPDGLIATLAAFEIPMIPTIVGFEALANAGQTGREATQLERETVPPKVLAAFDEPLHDERRAAFVAESSNFLSTQRQNWRDNVRRLHDAGVTILAGSDMQSGVFPGAGLHRELRHLTEAHLSPLEVIQAATVEAARFLEAKADPTFGIVAPGKRADLLLVDGDPLEDIDALSRIRAVLARGALVERHPLSKSAN
jgi:imidazolonepropionase-like amidohydrolase